MILVPRTSDSLVVTFILLCIAAIGIYCCATLFWTLCRSFLAENIRAVGIATISSVGAIGGIVSPVFVGWVKVMTGSFEIGFGAIGVLLMVGILLLLAVFGRDGARWGEKILSTPATASASA